MGAPELGSRRLGSFRWVHISQISWGKLSLRSQTGPSFRRIHESPTSGHNDLRVEQCAASTTTASILRRL
jgi:hypothetical protein